jgi:hypothetical protein
MDDALSAPEDALWLGIDLKLDHARFHFERMGAVLVPPEPLGPNFFKAKSGEGHDWHLPFYAHLDAFLSAARSIPELIRCCFGHDTDRRMKRWFGGLSADEQRRRKLFSVRFCTDLKAFRKLSLGNARHDSEHRRGYPPATVTTFGLLGVTYAGSPIERLPTSERKRLPEEYASYERPVAIGPPRRRDFQINGVPLLEMCENYVAEAQKLIDKARVIAREVHGAHELTLPQSDV